MKEEKNVLFIDDKVGTSKSKLLEEIETVRKVLEEEITNQNMKELYSIKIVEISEKLDVLIYEYLLLNNDSDNLLNGGV